MANGIVSDKIFLGERHRTTPWCAHCSKYIRNDLTQLKCGHVFHTQCLNDSFQYSQGCPLREHCKNTNSIRMAVLDETPSVSKMMNIVGEIGAIVHKTVGNPLKEARIAEAAPEELNKLLAKNTENYGTMQNPDLSLEDKSNRRERNQKTSQKDEASWSESDRRKYGGYIVI